MPPLDDSAFRSSAADLLQAAAAASPAVANALMLVDAGRGSLVLAVSVGARHVATRLEYRPDDKALAAVPLMSLR